MLSLKWIGLISKVDKQSTFKNTSPVVACSVLADLRNLLISNRARSWFRSTRLHYHQALDKEEQGENDP